MSATLEALYQRVPKVACKGLCGAKVCGPIGCSERESEALRAASGKPLTFDPRTLTCGYLDAEGRCSVYAVRPMICRLLGAVQSRKLYCPHGCRAEKPLREEEARALLRQVEKIGGRKVFAQPA